MWAVMQKGRRIMETTNATPAEIYAMLVASLVREHDVTYAGEGPQTKKRFGATELKVGGKIFAMLVRDRLVVKLPQARVAALVAAGTGERFDPRHDGRLMKEWLVIAPSATEQWQSLAEEALAFVGAAPR